MDWIKIIFLLRHILHISSQTYTNEEAGLTAMPTDIPNDSTTILIRNNFITTIPSDAFSGFYQLQVLRLNGNPLTEFPNLIPVGSTLETLSMQVGNIQEINATIFNELRALVDLKMRKNRLVSFPNVPGPGNSLVYLRLQGNQLTEFPAVSHYKKLHTLELGGNPLTSAQDSAVEGLTELRVISIGKIPTEAVVVPYNPKALQFLETLDLSSSNMTVVPLTCPRVSLSVLGVGSGVSLCRCENVWLAAMHGQRGSMDLDDMTCEGAGTIQEILSKACPRSPCKRKGKVGAVETKVIRLKHEGFLCLFPMHSYVTNITKFQCTLRCIATLGCLSFSFLPGGAATPEGSCVLVAPTLAALSTVPDADNMGWKYYTMK